jgi:hypothetical protein
MSLTTRIIRSTITVADEDARIGAPLNESATDVYGQVMGKPVGQDFDRMVTIYDLYCDQYAYALGAIEAAHEAWVTRNRESTSPR